jgi:citrate synthase
MKAITPVNIWHEGTLKEASLLVVNSSYDDLNTYASFSYRIMQELEAPQGVPPMMPAMMPAVMNMTVVSGQVSMNGQDYIDWDNSNEAAYEYVAEKLNLTIVPAP